MSSVEKVGRRKREETTSLLVVERGERERVKVRERERERTVSDTLFQFG